MNMDIVKQTTYNISRLESLQKRRDIAKTEQEKLAIQKEIDEFFLSTESKEVKNGK